VVERGTVTTVSIGSSTSSTRCCSNVSAPAASWLTSVPSSPSCRDWVIIERISASSKLAATSSVGVAPNSRTKTLAVVLKNQMTGLRNRVKAASGGSQGEGGGVRAGQRDVLGHHLAEHHVQHRHDRQGDDQRDRVQQRVGARRARAAAPR
jgi:hypothetical protein